MEAGEPTDLPPFRSLPSDLIFHILKNLPVKTLLRFRCVCKDWNSVITSQSFINDHLLSQPLGHLFSNHRACCSFPDKSFSLVHKFKVPLPQQESYRILIGSLDGLLCLTDLTGFGRVLHLWNPSIRKCKTLSNTCSFNVFHPEREIAFGLGFRVRTSDHIIIRIAVFEWESVWDSEWESERLKSNPLPLPLAEVYSLRTGSWKEVAFSEDVSKRLMIIRKWEYVNLNGDLNWMATFSDGQGGLYDSILSFDVNEEEFREIRLPSDYENGLNLPRQRVCVYRGSLAVIIFGPSIPDDGNDCVRLWVMEEYGMVDSWTSRTVKMTRRILLKGLTLDSRIVFSRSGRVDNDVVELLDMENGEEQQFCIPDFEFVHPFKETLVSLQGATVSSE